MRDLKAIIEAAYVLFAPYTLGPSLDVCKVCCVTDADERELLATPLRQASCELLRKAFFRSARSGSDQERRETKHFLSRLLELISQYEFPCVSLEIALNRLDLREHQHWPEAERALLAEFALAYVRQCLRQYPLPDNIGLSEVLLMFGLAHIDLAPLLRAWAAADTPASIIHFSDLLLDELRFMSTGTIKLLNPFSEPRINAQLAAWLSNAAVRSAWAARLLGAVTYSQLPNAEAARASAAYEVLTRAL